MGGSDGDLEGAQRPLWRRPEAEAVYQGKPISSHCARLDAVLRFDDLWTFQIATSSFVSSGALAALRASCALLSGLAVYLALPSSGTAVVRALALSPHLWLDEVALATTAVTALYFLLAARFAWGESRRQLAMGSLDQSVGRRLCFVLFENAWVMNAALFGVFWAHVFTDGELGVDGPTLLLFAALPVAVTADLFLSGNTFVISHVALSMLLLGGVMAGVHSVHPQLESASSSETVMWAIGSALVLSCAYVAGAMLTTLRDTCAHPLHQ